MHSSAIAENGVRLQEIEIKKGQNILGILKNHGISEKQSYEAIKSLTSNVDFKKIKSGQKIILMSKETDGIVSMKEISFVSIGENDETIKLINIPNTNKYEAFYINKVNSNKNLIKINLNVKNNIFTTLKEKGFNDAVINNVSKSVDRYINANRDIKSNSDIEMLLEGKIDKNGNVYDYGKIMYVGLKERKNLKISDDNDDYYLQMYNHDFQDGKSMLVSINKTNKSSTTPSSVRKKFISPLTNSVRISSKFGNRVDPVAGKVERLHAGIDLAVNSGTKVHATAEGVVDYVGWYGGYGKYVRIKHPGDYFTCYAHLNSFVRNLKIGQKVKQGQIIATSGNTGRTCGPHLHYEIRHKNRPLNPQNFTDFSSQTKKSGTAQSFDPMADMGITELRNFKQNIGMIREASAKALDITGDIL
ncbi:peptidoglycan DD-metalloendopeptidase family protein [Anaplasmataceae bacterium AB001_6]|nr:peptidoglycan DD-metalloendopeptidase family protein [Anaplasmataceae bacterium AB001_6]